MEKQSLSKREYESPSLSSVRIQPENMLCQSKIDVASNTESVGNDTDYTFEW